MNLEEKILKRKNELKYEYVDKNGEFELLKGVSTPVRELALILSGFDAGVDALKAEIEIRDNTYLKLLSDHEAEINELKKKPEMIDEMPFTTLKRQIVELEEKHATRLKELDTAKYEENKKFYQERKLIRTKLEEICPHARTLKRDDFHPHNGLGGEYFECDLCGKEIRK